MSRSALSPLLCLGFLTLAPVVAATAAGAQEFTPLGDGSYTNNQDLLRDDATGCENCAPQPPHEEVDPWFDPEFSLALRGSYTQGPSGGTFALSAIPSVTLTHDTLRGGYTAGASAELTRSMTDEVRLAAARTSLAGSYQLDETTVLSGGGNLSLTQESANAPGTDPTIAIQPLVFAGDGTVQLEKSFGQAVLTGRLNASRTGYGPTTLVDSSTIDNSDQSSWTVGAGLRAGYRVTPTLTAFVDGSAGYQTYDAPSPVYLTKLDAADYQLRTGIAVKLNEVLDAEASVGIGLRRFADPVFPDAIAALYDASLSFRPDETLTLTGSFSTSFGAPGPSTGGNARLEYAAAGDVAYRVNPWLTLRASAGWSRASLLGTLDTELSTNAGVGADYLINEHTALTADYAYAQTQTVPNPAEDSHTVSLGVTLKR